MTATKQQPIAGYRISDPSDPTIKPWLSDTPDDNGYTSEPLYAGAAPAAVAPQGEYPHEQMDAMALARYNVVPSHASMLWSHAVVAGDGAQQLYVGREVECQNMARKFAGAFLDGAFAFHSMAAAPSAQAAPALEAPVVDLGDLVAVPRDLIGSACAAIVQRRAAPKTLAELRRYTTGDLSRHARAAAPQALATDLTDAYTGAREDLTIWKRRALEAERDLRAEREANARLVAEINAASGPTHMGEAAPQAPAAPVDDLAQLVKQLVRALRKAAPGNDLADKALDYLKRQGLQGSPLRTAHEAPPTHVGLLAAAAHIQAKAQAHLDERGSYDPDTGAVEMSESNQEHFNTLDELAEEIRLMADKAAPAPCGKPPQAPATEPVARAIFTNRNKPDVEWLVESVTRGMLLYAAPQAPDAPSYPTKFGPNDWVMDIAGVIVKLEEWEPGAVKAHTIYGKRHLPHQRLGWSTPDAADAFELAWRSRPVHLDRPTDKDLAKHWWQGGVDMAAPAAPVCEDCDDTGTVYDGKRVSFCAAGCAASVVERRADAAAPAAPAVDASPLIARNLAEWHEDDGDVSWWAWCGNGWAGEPAWIGRPTDDGWPGYHTHWTAHPAMPPAIAAQAAAKGAA